MLPPSKMDSQSTGFAGSLTSQSVDGESNPNYSGPNGVCYQKHFPLMNSCADVVSHHVLRFFRPALSLD